LNGNDKPLEENESDIRDISKTIKVAAKLSR
jgi:hypothetical protein